MITSRPLTTTATHGPRSRGDDLKLAVFAILLSVLALSLGDALIKRISADFPLWQVFVVRSAITVPVLVAVIRLGTRTVALIPRAFGWTLLRSLMLTLMWVVYYSALPHVDLSVAAAAFYTLPLFITLFAHLFVGEAVGARGWIAVLTGFCGMLAILRPQGQDFNAHALLPLVSAVLYALAMILTRTRCRDENPLVLALALNVSFIVVGALATLAIAVWAPSPDQIETQRFLLGDWPALGAREWLAMGLLAAAILIGSAGAAVAYQRGPASVVSTFDFAYLAFAGLWGLVFFAEVPDALTAAGMALIAAAGILAVRR